MSRWPSASYSRNQPEQRRENSLPTRKLTGKEGLDLLLTLSPVLPTSQWVSDLFAQPPLFPKALLPRGTSPFQHDAVRPTLGDTTLMSSLRKRNLPTSSWKRLPQLFMQDSSTWGEGPGESQHGISSRIRSQLLPASPSPGAEPVASVTAAQRDIPCSLPGGQAPSHREARFLSFGPTWLNSPSKRIPSERP